MATTLGACEYEDSTNCFWNAQEAGNGIGQSFVDIDGIAYYVNDTTVHSDTFVWEDINGVTNHLPFEYMNGELEGEPSMVMTWQGDISYSCPEGRVPGWMDENGVPQACVDNSPNPVQPEEAMVVPEAPEIEVPEVIESVGATPEYVDAGVTELAETGSVDVITGLLLGIALVTSGVVMFIKSKKTQTV